MKNDERAFALDCDAVGSELLVNLLDLVIIETFAERIVKFHPESRINFIELFLRQRFHLAPDREVFRVAALQFHEFGAGTVECGLMEAGLFRVALRADGFVDPIHLAERIGLQCLPVK